MIGGDHFIDCPKCKGRGKLPDQVKLGYAMRNIRGKESLRSLGKRIGFSAPYLCDLEKGRRNWTDALMKKYLEECI